MAPTSLLDNCSDSELKRFAICFLYSDRAAIDWEAASANFDPKVKVASFKTVTTRALTKVLRDIADGNNNNGETTTLPSKPTKANAGKKRKAASELDATTSALPAKKGKAAAKFSKAKPKKGRAKQLETVSEEDGEADQEDEDKTIIKAEQVDEDADADDESQDEV